MPQTTVRRTYDQADQGGHLIASRFGGSGEQINYVPMPKSVNGTSGSWYKMEEEWASKIESGIIITNILTRINYSGNSKKPTSFEVSWKENGVLNPDDRGKAGPALIIQNQ